MPAAAKQFNVGSRHLGNGEMPESYAVFLCHNSADKPDVRTIGARLRSRGHTVFLDEWELRPGFPWQERVEGALGSSKAVAVFVGPNGFGQWQEDEMRAALSRQKDAGIAVVPVGLPGVALDSLPPFLKERTWVSFSTIDSANPTFAIDFDRLVWAITGEKSELLRAQSAPRPAPVQAPPPDRVADMIRRFSRGIPQRNLLCILGRSWTSQAHNENAALASQFFRELQVAEDQYRGFLPALDDLATCFSVVRGGETPQFAVQTLFGEGPRAGMDPLSKVARILKRILQMRQGARSLGEPIIVSTSLDLNAERALLREGVPFIRLVQKVPSRIDDRLEAFASRFDVRPALAANELELTAAHGSVVFDRTDAGSVDNALRSIEPEVLQVDDPARALPLGAGHVVLIKYFGSLDIADTCVLTRDHAVYLAQAAARFNQLSSLIQGALASRPCLCAGLRPLDVDFILLYHTLLRKGLSSANSNPRCMLASLQDLGVADGDSSHLLMHEIERNNWESIRDNIQLLGVQLLNASPLDFLRRLGAEIGAPQ